MDKIAGFRQEIDLLDQKIADLLDNRLSIVMKIKEEKKKTNLNIEDLNREKEILASFKNVKHKDEVEEIYQRIFSVSKSIQAK